MATSPAPIAAEKMKADAQKHFAIICKAAAPVSVNSLRIGFHAAYLKRNNLFGILGFKTEKEAIEISGVKESTYYNVQRIAEAFHGVEEECFVAMKLSNAEALLDLSDQKRRNKKWLELAADKSMREFRDLIDEELDGKEKPSTGREKVVSITIKAPRSRKKVVESGLDEISKEFGCDGDRSKTLELMVAERRESVSLIGSITAAINDVSIAKSYGNMNLSAAEVLEKVYVKLDEIVDRFQKALEDLSNWNPDQA